MCVKLYITHTVNVQTNLSLFLPWVRKEKLEELKRKEQFSGPLALGACERENVASTWEALWGTCRCTHMHHVPFTLWSYQMPGSAGKGLGNPLEIMRAHNSFMQGTEPVQVTSALRSD